MINQIKRWGAPVILLLSAAVLTVTGCRWFLQTLGTRLLYADSFMGRFYRFFYVPWILAGILLAAGLLGVRRLKKEEYQGLPAVVEEAETAVKTEAAAGTTDEIICPQCGTRLKASAVFCKNCGTRIKIQEEA